MHAGFGAQEAIGIVAIDLDGCTADAGDIAVGLFEDLGGEAFLLAVLEVLAQRMLAQSGDGATGPGCR
jgi:hypothetical protein